MQRSGVYIANFQTADKLSVEAFPLPEGADAAALDAGGGGGSAAVPPESPLVLAVVGKLLNPGSKAGGDSRLEMPPPRRIQSEVKQAADGKVGGQLRVQFDCELITKPCAVYVTFLAHICTLTALKLALTPSALLTLACPPHCI